MENFSNVGCETEYWKLRANIVVGVEHGKVNVWGNTIEKEKFEIVNLIFDIY